MPGLKMNLDAEEAAFNAQVDAIERDWQSLRQSHLKRFVRIFGNLLFRD